MNTKFKDIIQKLELTRAYYVIRVLYLWLKIVLTCITQLVVIVPLMALLAIPLYWREVLADAVNAFKRTRNFDSFQRAIKDEHSTNN